MSSAEDAASGRMRKRLVVPLRWAGAFALLVAALLLLFAVTGGCEPEGVCEPLFVGVVVGFVAIPALVWALFLLGLSFVLGRAAGRHNAEDKEED